MNWISFTKSIDNGPWITLTKENAAKVAMKKYHGETLFDYLIRTKQYEHARILMTAIPFTDEIIHRICLEHNQDYLRIIRTLSDDNMIELYEKYQAKVHGESTQKIYRKVITTRCSKINEDVIDRTEQILRMFDEFNFLTHEYIDDFFIFASGLTSLDYITSFVFYYKSYTELVPIIQSVVNEYYLEYIVDQVSNIDDLFANSYIILEEHYKNILKWLQSLPIKYIDPSYQNYKLESIVNLIAGLPLLDETLNCSIVEQVQNIMNEDCFTIVDLDGNTIIHTAFINQNYIFIRAVAEKYKQTISPIMPIANLAGDTIFDIIFTNNMYEYIPLLTYELPEKVQRKITALVIDENIDINKIPSDPMFTDQLVLTIDYYMDLVVAMKQSIMYDIYKYNCSLTKIITLIVKIDNVSYRWLEASIEIDELRILKILTRHNIEDLSGLLTLGIKLCRVNIIEYLLTLEPEVKSSHVIGALATKNQHLIRTLAEYAKLDNVYRNVLEDYLSLYVPNNTYTHIVKKLWNTININM